MPQKKHEPNAETKKHKFEEDLDLFLSDLRASKDVFPVIMVGLISKYEELYKEYNKILKDVGTKVKKGKKTVYKIPFKDFGKVEKNLREKSKLERMILIEPRSQVVSLVSLYDAYLGKFIKSLLKNRSDILYAVDGNLTYSQMLHLRDFENIEDFLLEKEVESLLRKSHIDQIKWIEEKFSIKLTVDLEIWPKFIEITERRNLFVHTDGKISRQYLNVCNKYGCATENLKLGDQLEATKSYVVTANYIFFEMAAKLTQVLWRKLLPDELEAADDSLIDVSYQLLEDENYSLAKNILDFGVSVLKKHFDDSHKKVLILNRAIAYKFSDGQDSVIKQLDDVDWSSSGDTFKLAVNVLKDEFQKANEIMKRISKEKLGKEQYREWPLFKAFRKSEEFKSAYKEIFKEDFENEQSERSMNESKSKQNEK